MNRRLLRLTVITLKTVLAVGKRALMMHEKTHESIRTIRPLKDGVIADFNAAELNDTGNDQNDLS